MPVSEFQIVLTSASEICFWSDTLGNHPSERSAFSVALRMRWDCALPLRNHPEQLRVRTNDPMLPSAPHGFQLSPEWVVALKHARVQPR
jgi:hypothetical protein